MKTRDLFSLAVRNLWRRKLRTFLTVLGVIIGCASIVIMVSFALAQRAQMDELVNSSTTLTSLNVSPNQYYDPQMGDKMPKKGIITDEVVKKFEAIPGVKKVIVENTLDNNGTQRMKLDKYMVTTRLAGTSLEDMELTGMKIIEGRNFESKSKDIEVIVGENFGWHLHDEKMMKRGGGRFDPPKIDPVGKTIKLEIGNLENARTPLSELNQDSNQDQEIRTGKETIRLKIVGVYETSNMMGGTSLYTSNENIDLLKDKIDKLVLSEKDYKEKKKKNKKVYQNCAIHLFDVDQMESVKKKVEEMDFSTYSQSDYLDQMKQGTDVASAILTGIGSISLIVAAIGITNTMVMSIYERTKEIGVMKVIGASVPDIRNMFLLEAGMIGLMGGGLGLGISYGVSSLLNQLFQQHFGSEPGVEGVMISIIPLWLSIGALFFSFLIGVITGYYPAKRATKLSAIEAIRTE